MLPFAGKPLLQHQLELLNRFGIERAAVVKGYRGDRVIAPGTKAYWNSEFATTNMVSSLFTAEAELAEDIIITYGDVIYDAAFLRSVLDFTGGDIGVAIDMQWRTYYDARFSDALSDAESLRMTPDRRIIDIGRRSPLPEDIHGQYVGVLKVTRQGCEQLRKCYHQLCARCSDTFAFRGRDLRNLYMTDLIQILIDSSVPVHAIAVNHGWLEFDSAEDFKRAEDWRRSGQLGEFCRI